MRKIDTIVLYALPGQYVEVAFANPAADPSTIRGTNSFRASQTSGVSFQSFSITSSLNLTYPQILTLSGTVSGAAVVTFGKVRAIIADKKYAGGFWAPRLETATATGHARYDLTPDIPSVLVHGPYFVRSASASGSTLNLKGDINGTTTIDIYAPAQFTSFTWNGSPLSVEKADVGSLRGTISLPAAISREAVLAKIPKLSGLEWRCKDSLPELESGFDDGAKGWVAANKTSTTRPQKPSAGKYVLYSSE